MTVNFTAIAKIIIIMPTCLFLLHFFTTVKFTGVKKWIARHHIAEAINVIVYANLTISANCTK